MNKTLLSIVAAGLLLVTTAQASDIVNVYSARKEALIKPLLDEFSATTGIKVNLITGKADALLKRLQVEGSATPADLFITVDTALAHLAGSLGVKCWIMLPFAPDWRWQLDKSDTPWYPSIKLFRQQERSNWAPVINQIASSLKDFPAT